ncbi:polysaccharide deacetylase family protein [Maledivibacter halophilus]|uniref:Predicted xylanase/chitin deacetylase n=1 Tax=Maledivibacter halophilus TaxID=36842 RepID=A0A1T5LSX4_9FIRM|nr:polysaccharide deacetylase family protein [Maledivibacter halophilus]SKC79040.1 Predicted xylanase/chitin deacetylase [Maledivibacter halophilus]
MKKYSYIYLGFFLVLLLMLFSGFTRKNIFHTNKEIIDSSKVEIAKNISILSYHHILKNEENPFPNNESILSVEKFKEQMKFLHDNKYNTITLNELEKFLKGEIELPKNSVVITFDDGYKSNYVYAYPILKEYGFKASIFMITELITNEPTEFDPKTLQYLSWSEMIKAQDVFEYASHTNNLHKLDANNKSFLVRKPEDVVYDDLKKTQEILKTTYFAYPYGQYNKNTLDILNSLNFKMAFTTKSGTVKPGNNILKLKRYVITPNISLNKFKKIVDRKFFFF